MTPPKSAIVIPAFKPTDGLERLLDELSGGGLPVVLVDDGSGPEFRERFLRFGARENVELVGHVVNQGKGAALRTGFNHAMFLWPGVRTLVTADADGQHLAADVVNIAAQAAARPNALVLGSRSFGEGVPWRSRFGNRSTSLMFGLLYGVSLRDTQTGLRAIPQSLAVTMLSSDASGYEFELDMLITSRRMSIAIEQVPIQTVYLDGNSSSHFNPLLDSMRIYFILLRFSATSLLSAICDNMVFYAAITMSFSPLAAQAMGRFLAACLNFQLNRNLVFRSKGSSSAALLRYFAVVVASGVISYLSLMSLHTLLAIPLMAAKLGVEALMFLANFALQRDFVFRAEGKPESKD